MAKMAMPLQNVLAAWGFSKAAQTPVLGLRLLPAETFNEEPQAEKRALRYPGKALDVPGASSSTRVAGENEAAMRRGCRSWNATG